MNSERIPYRPRVAAAASKASSAHCMGCVELKDQLDIAREHIIQLQGELGVVKNPLDLRLLGFTQTQADILGILLAANMATYESIMTRLYSGRPSEKDIPDLNNIKAIVCHIRNKLRPHGIEIETQWGVGYRLSMENKEKLKKLIAEAA